MHRTTLTLLTFSGSLAAMILLSNPANAAPIIELTTNPAMSLPTAEIVSLNRATPILNLMMQESNPITDQMGCGCATCMQARSQI